LDTALGVGGFARGRLYEVFGPNSCGKTTLALSVALQGMKNNIKTGFIDAEHALDPKLIRNMGKEIGVSPDEMEIVQGYTGDDNLEIAELLMSTGEFGVMIVDSVSALIPKAVAEKDIGEDTIARLAALMSKACQKLTPVANKTNTCLIFINQIRHSIGSYGDDRRTSGGEALGFYTTGRIRVIGGESKTSRIIDGGSEKGLVIGHKSLFTIIKNKLSAPWRSATIDLIYGKGYDFKGETIELAIQLGIIDQMGAWFEYMGNKYQGKANLINAIYDNNLYEELRIKVLDGIGMNYDVVLAENESDEEIDA
jgi:recombination protein RecA